ncbi:iron-containing alcohol dehydrogenase [Stenotrophomonas maltophilia]|uniref:iron-containing alcohol dehydrogenase n=1 Tax=Stenotrophomonas maltophilia TaxID=40324 RepID=UPI0039C2E4FF
MQNFDFYNPTMIAFGEGTICKIDSLVPQESRVMILYGGQSAERHGTLDEVRSALGPRHQIEFGGIEPNPGFDTLMKAVDLARVENVDFLLAVGGGSVIDGAKFVAAAALFEGDPWQILESYGSVVSKALPLGAVLTLPATGSEMNSGASITRYDERIKTFFRSPHVFPRFSILDPVKTYSLPQRQLANGVIDAFVHVVEQYLTYPVDARVQDRFAEGLMLTLIEIGPDVVHGPADYQQRANLVWAATMALSGVIRTGVPEDWSTHMIGLELTALFGLDHAQTLAVLLPSTLRVCSERKHVKLLQYAERVWQITDGTEEERIDLAIESTRTFFSGLGAETKLSGYGIGSSAVDMVVRQLHAHGMTQLGEHGDVTLDVSRRIVEASL